jgi:lysylphosphatidylglycerol synthetase-like protein (DUF2156 family)
MMANSQSPFEDLFIDITHNIRNNFKRHDKYLNFALLLAFVPLPFIGFIALTISLIGFYLNHKNRFTIDETSRLVAIFILSMVNISLTLIFALNIYSIAFDLFFEVVFAANQFFYGLFNTVNTYI